MNVWYVPSWSGDYRLTANGDDKSILSIEQPTPAEIKVLKTFFAVAGPDWMPNTPPRLTAKTKFEVELEASVAVVAPVLLSAAHQETPLWTGVKSEAGKVTLIDAPAEEVVAALPATTVAAATVRKPGIGCPEPVPCNVRASEVLAAFCTPRQMDDWNARGSMTVRGNVTAERYTLYHRNAAAQRHLQRCLMDARGLAVCAWHDDLPPEEEALALKFLVEHREALLLRGHGVAGGTPWGRRYTGGTRFS